VEGGEDNGLNDGDEEEEEEEGEIDSDDHSKIGESVNINRVRREIVRLLHENPTLCDESQANIGESIASLIDKVIPNIL
jgi:hypothetical protein